MDYKEYHEAQMLNHSGSSVIEIQLLLTTVIFGIFFVEFISIYCPNKNNYSSFFKNVMLIALPIVLSVTVLSDLSYAIPLHVALIFIVIIFKNVNFADIEILLTVELGNKKSYITNYRACTNLVSALCILAVDFSIFPRRFAKTETFGYALMDLGVGFFILSNGIVAKDVYSWSQCFKIIKSCSVFIILGLIRLISVKSTNYHEHASEYGVHWNFFFTLGFCRLISFLIGFVSPIKSPLALALTTGTIHQSLLYFGLQEWVLYTTERDTWLSANREGISSLLGYISLYYGSVSLGQKINNVKSPVTYRSLLYHLLLISLFMWVCTGVSYFTTGVSRRLVNIGYISWIVASTATVIMQLVIVEFLIIVMKKNSLKTLPVLPSCTPALMECINFNGLCFFLISNLLTGMINFLFHTLLLDYWASLAIINLYMLLICWTSYILYYRKLIIKF